MRLVHEVPVEIFIPDWGKLWLKSHENVSLVEIVLEMYYAEPKLIGKFICTTVDKRLEMRLLAEPGGHVALLRLSYFAEVPAGTSKRTAELRHVQRGKNEVTILTVTAPDEDCWNFLNEQVGWLERVHGDNLPRPGDPPIAKVVEAPAPPPVVTIAALEPVPVPEPEPEVPHVPADKPDWLRNLGRDR